MTPLSDSRHLEELTLNAWPPIQTLLYDGWLLGFSGGYTRRANSVQPLYPSTLPIGDKIAACEAIHAARGIPITFKITSAGADPELDAVLARCDYAIAAPTSVQTADLVTFPPPAPDSAVAIETTLSDAWFAAFNRLSATPPKLQASERALLEKIAPPHCFGSITVDDTIAAVGLAVAERAHVGLFDIVVAPESRNRGLARRLCTALLQWARTDEGARTAYLAVMQSNAPAIHLYAALGFREQYTYWYRHKPLTAESQSAG